MYPGVELRLYRYVAVLAEELNFHPRGGASACRSTSLSKQIRELENYLRAAFDDFHINRLTALVHPENIASIRVLEKLRYQPERRDTIMGMNPILFFLDL